MSCADRARGRSGYLEYLPSSYQVLGPERDPGLDKVLCSSPASHTTATPTIYGYIQTPNVRCRTRVSISLEPRGAAVNVDTDLNTAVLGGTASLWMALKTRSTGQRLKQSPTRNLVATGAAPLAIPTDTRLWGFEYEIETDGDEIMLAFVPPAGAAPPLAAYEWRCVVRYESVVPLSPEEWDQFKGRYGLRLLPEGTVLT